MTDHHYNDPDADHQWEATGLLDTSSQPPQRQWHCACGLERWVEDPTDAFDGGEYIIVGQPKSTGQGSHLDVVLQRFIARTAGEAESHRVEEGTMYVRVQAP